MKKLFLLFLLAVAAFDTTGQKLIDIYKKGTVKLVPDEGYGRDNNWDAVFSTYYDTLYHTPLGGRKSLIVLPDGSALVNHAYRNYYSKFSPSGKFEKEFGVMNSRGHRFSKVNSVKGYIGNVFITSPDNTGDAICFDFEGKYMKTLRIDYMVRQMIILPGEKIGVVGWVIWKDRFRDFVSIIDYETNSEKVVWEHFTERPEMTGTRKLFNYNYTFKYGGGTSCTTMPFSSGIGLSAPPKIQSAGEKLVVAIPMTGEILVYDLNGKLLSKDDAAVSSGSISVTEQKEIQQKAIEKYREMRNTDDSMLFGLTKARISMMKESPEKEEAMKNIGKIAKEQKLSMIDYFLAEMEKDLNRISEPLRLPAFSTIIKDSDGNLLLFEYPKEANGNKFQVWVFENEGKLLCRSSFECDDYKLEINPDKMVFSNGFLYGLQLLKDAQGVPLRLVRFRLSGM